ncbi:hypothetical protein ACS0TY_015385 [Phlomoides rotata]
MDPDHVPLKKFLYSDGTEQIDLPPLPPYVEEEEEEEMDVDYRDFLTRSLHPQEQEEEETEEEEEDEDEEEDERDGENVAGVDVGGQSVTTSRQVLHDNHVSYINSHVAREVVNVDDLPAEGERDCSSQMIDIGDNKGSATASLKGDNGEEISDLNKDQIDGLICPSAMRLGPLVVVTTTSDHFGIFSCLPCGHIYGLSCIKKWFLRPGSSKCPRCRKKCGLKSIRLLYASRVVAVDRELQKTVESLEAECASLRRMNADWSKREAELKEIEADMNKNLQYLKQVGYCERLSTMEQKFLDIEVQLDPMYAMVRQMYEFQIGQGHSELPIHEMVQQMHELLIGQGHSEPLPPRQGE